MEEEEDWPTADFTEVVTSVGKVEQQIEILRKRSSKHSVAISDMQNQINIVSTSNNDRSVEHSSLDKEDVKSLIEEEFSKSCISSLQKQVQFLNQEADEFKNNLIALSNRISTIERGFEDTQRDVFNRLKLQIDRLDTRCTEMDEVYRPLPEKMLILQGVHDQMNRELRQEQSTAKAHVHQLEERFSSMYEKVEKNQIEVDSCTSNVATMASKVSKAEHEV